MDPIKYTDYLLYLRTQECRNEWDLVLVHRLTIPFTICFILEAASSPKVATLGHASLWVSRAVTQVEPSPWYGAGPCGAPRHKALLCLPFLWLQETAFIYPPWPSLSSKGQIQAVVNEGREGMRDQGETSSQESPWGKALLPHQGIHTTVSLSCLQIPKSFPSGTRDKEPACHCKRCKRCGFYPWVSKIPWRRRWQPTPVFLPGESMDGGAYGQWATGHRVTESQTTEWLSTHADTETPSRSEKLMIGDDRWPTSM